ncbi:MAG: hypothetical protein AB3N20_09555 [Rhizobiaceae bacterium]
MKTETDARCQTLSHDLDNFRIDIARIRKEISRLKSSIQSQENEIDGLRAENIQLQSLAAAAQLRGGIGGVAAAAAARAKITRNTIRISRLEAAVASIRQEIDNKKFTMESWMNSARQAELMIQQLDCSF